MRYLILTILLSQACTLDSEPGRPADAEEDAGVEVAATGQPLIDSVNWPGCYLSDTQPTIYARMGMRRMAVAYAATISQNSPAGNYILGTTNYGELAWPIWYQASGVKSWWSHATPTVGRCYGDQVDVTYTTLACDVATNAYCGTPSNSDRPTGYGDRTYQVTFVAKCTSSANRIANTPVYVRWGTSTTYKSVPESWNGALCPCPEGSTSC